MIIMTMLIFTNIKLQKNYIIENKKRVDVKLNLHQKFISIYINSVFKIRIALKNKVRNDLKPNF